MSTSPSDSLPTMSTPSSTGQAPSGTSLSSLSSTALSSTSGADTSSPPPPASSSTPHSTPTPSSTPTTDSSTPTTTPPSSPAQTSSAPARTTPSASGSSGSSPSSAPAVVSTSAFTSQVATTFSTTDPGGSVVYVTSTIPEVITTSISSGSAPSSSSNTGVIVGSVVGGIAGIIIIALLLFCIRRRVRLDEFDGNFDPDRVVGHAEAGGGTLPNVDLAGDVMPFPVSQPYTDQGSASMRQYGKSPYIPVPSSLGASGHASSEFYPPGSMGAGPSMVDAQQRTFMQPGAVSPPPGAYAPSINMYGTGPMDWHNPRPSASPPPSSVSNTTTSTRTTKEREAMGRSGQGPGLGLATQPEAAEGSGDVVVHQDAGRAPIEEHVSPREIPPSYDSIRQD